MYEDSTGWLWLTTSLKKSAYCDAKTIIAVELASMFLGDLRVWSERHLSLKCLGILISKGSVVRPGKRSLHLDEMCCDCEHLLAGFLVTVCVAETQNLPPYPEVCSTTSKDNIPM